MILDERTEFLDNVAIPTSAGTSFIGDVIDTTILRDLGDGQPIYWYVSLDEAAAGGTSARIELVTSASENLGTPTVLLDTGVVLLAALTPAGKMIFQAALPLEGPAYLRYLGIQIIVAGTMSAGKISSGLMLDPHGKPTRFYADAVN